ncbi:MAG: helix-turn-helix domain-containing protein [Bacteroidales bacterium]
MGHQQRREREKKEMKQRILDAALQIAMSRGWEGVTIRKIADRIEYAPPIVYAYFRNKAELFDELGILGHRMLSEDNHRAVSGVDDPREALLRVSLNFWDFAFLHKELYQLMFSLNRTIPGEVIALSLEAIKRGFFDLVGEQEEAKEVMFSWMCFQQGYIHNVKQMGLPADLGDRNPRDLFQRAMKTYLSHI